MGLIAGRLADRFHRMKTVLLVLNFTNVVALAVFSAASQPLMQLSPTATLAVIWASAVMSNMCLFGAVPIFFELCLECAFPTHSSLVLFVAVTVNNTANISLLFIPVSTSPVVFNWAYTIGCACATTLLAFGYREQLKRLAFDSGASGISESLQKDEEPNINAAFN